MQVFKYQNNRILIVKSFDDLKQVADCARPKSRRINFATLKKEKMNRIIVLTNDGTSSVFCESFGQHYHSIHGALTESNHVFIKCGLDYCCGFKKIKLLEIGFGTGLNAILSLMYARSKKIMIDYYGVDLYPLNQKIAEQLNYFDVIDSGLRPEFLKMHESDEMCIELENMRFRKIRHDITTAFTDVSGFNLIYFDAFSPSVQPALWTEVVFRNIAEITAPGGVLVTYCSKGSVRRALKSVGFAVEKLPGPNGKREMIRAIRL